MEYYKKIDKSFFRYGFTIPQKYVKLFLQDDPINLGESRSIQFTWKKKSYKVRLSHVNIKNKKPVYQIRWDGNSSLLSELKKEFIQSYIAIESRNFEAKIEGKYYMTDLLGGNQEVIIIEPVSPYKINAKTFIKVQTPYDNLFGRLIDENVFGWLSDDSTEKLFTKTTKWFSQKELSKHEDVNHVVYYLIDEESKEIYIGSAKRTGDRVKIGRKEIPGWSRFRYEIVHPRFHHILKEVEYHSIMTFARFFKNQGGLSNCGISEYTLVNKDYKYYRK